MKIKYETEDLCVGCPQGCRHCGRGSVAIPVAIECEQCGEDFEELYETEDGFLCEKCLLEQYRKVSVDDIAEDTGEYCDEYWVKR